MIIYNKGRRAIQVFNGKIAKDINGKDQKVVVSIFPEKTENIDDEIAVKLLKMYPKDLILFSDLEQDSATEISKLRKEAEEKDKKIKELEDEIVELNSGDKKKLKDELKTVKEENEILKAHIAEHAELIEKPEGE